MGACNISYICILPQKIPARLVNQCTRALQSVDKMTKLLTPEKYPDVWVKLFALRSSRKAKGVAVELFKWATAVKDQFPGGLKEPELAAWFLGNYIWVQQLDDISELELPEYVGDDAQLLTQAAAFRDTAYHGVVIDGKRFTITSAGNLSWGDEPDGEGYKLLKRAFHMRLIQHLGGA